MVWCGTNGRIGAVQRRLLDLERCTAAGAGKPSINRLTTPIRNKKNAVYTPIQLHPSCDPVDLLPLLRGAEEGGARAIGTLNDSSLATSHRATGTIWEPQRSAGRRRQRNCLYWHSANAVPRRWQPDARDAHAALEPDGGRSAMRLWMMSLRRCVSCAASLSLARSSISNLMSASRFGSSTASASNFR